MRRQRWQLAALALLAVGGLPAAGAEPAELLARIKAVGREGKGNVEAGKAWRELVRGGPGVLLPTLAALDDASPTAANWLHSAVDAVAERALAEGKPLPGAKLEAFVKEAKHNGRARRLAYEWLTKVDPTAPDRLLPGMLHDPTSAELRRDAVARVLKDAEQLLQKGDKKAATAAYQKAFAAACDKDQVDQAARQLRELGVEADLAAHYGYVRRWMLVAPFDNTKESGYDRANPPEKGVDLSASYAGKNNVKASWTAHATTDPYGVVDLNKALGKQKGATAYAYAVVESPAERPVEVRAGCINAVKVFLNGKLVLGQEEYHHGMRHDQYVGRGVLKKGRNEILVKVCQNEQTEVWAQDWKFQVRLCDGVGAAVPFTVVAPKAGDVKEGK
ncbi:MAG TPA: hypothetical protein VFA26_12050 [Gemmataceae bacterium]|nr:hypothetical protein [Gemmataceae bacterium]